MCSFLFREVSIKKTLFLNLLTLYTTEGNAAHDELGEQQINDDDREDGECDHHIHLTHVKLQKVCASKLGDQNRQRFLCVGM